MADLELLRRLSVIADLTDEELEGARSYREGQDELEAMLESLEGAESEIRITDDEVAQLISEEARLLVILFEVTSQKVYERKYMRPIWPGGESGVTIGVGYDAGYNTTADVKRHWHGLLSDTDIALLCKACGLKGLAAKQRCPEFSSVVVPWDAALEAHRRFVAPRYGRMVLKAFPNSQQLHGHAFGALFSLVFNRGASMKNTDGRLEMRAIRDLMAAHKFEEVPDQIRKMKRLWEGKNLPGLLKRRDAEAALFERGLEMAMWSATVASAAPGGLESIGAAELERSDLSPDEIDGDGAAYEEMEEGLESLEAARGWDGVRWPEHDEEAPDYGHIGETQLAGSTFEFSPRDLELLIRANRFEPTREHGRIVFGLRGCELVTSMTSPTPMLQQEEREALTLLDVRPNHKDFCCILGVYNTATGRLSAFASSTVPNRKAVATYHANQSSGNMMPAGCYRFEVGWHLASKPTRRIPGCLIEAGRQKAVLRSTNNLWFDIEDTVENHRLHGDNLHPAKSEASAKFSSWGCLVVSGNFTAGPGGSRERGTHTGEWALFRKAMGWAKTGTGDHGKQYDFVLLTGLEASIVSHAQRQSPAMPEADILVRIGRLRQGSRGGEVAKLQTALGVAPTGVYDHKLTKLFADRQKATFAGKSDGIYSPEMDGHFAFGVFANPQVASAERPSAIDLGAALGARAPVLPPAQSLEAAHYEIGLLAEAARRNGGRISADMHESLSDTQLEMSFSDLKAIGRNIAKDLERRLQGYICGGDVVDRLVDRAQIQAQIDAAAQQGASAVRSVLIATLAKLTYLSDSIVAKVVDLIFEELVQPALAPAGGLVKEQIVVSAEWLCGRWSSRVADVAAPATAVAAPVAPMALVAPVSQPARPKVAAAPPPAPNKKIALLLSGISTAATGPSPDVPGVRHLMAELRRAVDAGEGQLDPQQSAALLAALVDSRTFDQIAGGSGADPYLLVAEVEKALAQRPIDRAGLRKNLDDLHGLLADARMRFDDDRAVAFLRKLRGAKQFNDLVWISDRLLTRNPALLGRIGTIYAQGLIDSGRIKSAIEVLNTVIEHGELPKAELDEANGILGRAHKQIYVNHVRSGSDAVALKDTIAPHIGIALDSYRKSYDPARPADNYYQGINYIALLKRAENDRVAVTVTEKADDLARKLVQALEPQAAQARDPWLLATIGEAYLVLGENAKAADYMGKYAQHPSVDAFALAGTVRQLEEVYRLQAEAQGAGAVLTGLKSALAAKEGAVVTLSAQERRLLQRADNAEFQAYFETATPGGRFINFYLLKRIVQCGSSVAAIQKPLGQTGQTQGTGFLVNGADLSPALDAGKSYVLTNAHVVWDPRLGSEQTEHALTSDNAQIVFESDLMDGRRNVYKCVKVHWQSPSSAYDACLMELDRRVEHLAPLSLAGSDMRLVADHEASGRGTRLAVLGHPKGGSLALSVMGALEEMKATLVDRGGKNGAPAPEYLHYWTPTEPGNSGSPVFEADNWHVVGLHHAGFNQTEGRPKLGGKAGVNMANEGISIHSIREAVNAHLRPVPQGKKKPWWSKGA